MQPQQSSIIIKPDVNVPSFRHHIGVSTCSHEVGTFHIAKNIYHNGEIQVLEDVKGSYHHKGIEFQIKDCWFISEQLKFELPMKTTITVFERVALALGIPLSKHDAKRELDVNSIPFRQMLQLLTMMALKDHKVISNSFSHRKQYKYGVNVFEAYYKAISGSGKIKAKRKVIRWLNEQDTLQLKAKLFKASSYQPNVNAMKYVPTELAEQIMVSVYRFIRLLKFKENEIQYQALDFKVTIDMLEQIKLRDVILLLSDCIGYDNGFIIRPRLKDEQYSRVYSVFTSIGSETRKILGFTNYDIGAALQTITLQLIGNPELYPLHQSLVDDKKAFRARIQGETGKDVAWVKKELSKIDNLENMPKRYKNYPTLTKYFKESLLLRNEIIESAEPLILSRAKNFAKSKLMKFWNPVTNKYDFIPIGLKESSIYFFIWTQWERQIRESMMSCFDEPSSCHQVHDAVYSKQILDPVTIEEKVLVDTGFKVQISTD